MKINPFHPGDAQQELNPEPIDRFRGVSYFVASAVIAQFVSASWRTGSFNGLQKLIDVRSMMILAGFGAIAAVASMFSATFLAADLSNRAIRACRIAAGVSMGMMPKYVERAASNAMRSTSLADYRGTFAMFISVLVLSAVLSLAFEMMLRRVAWLTSKNREVVREP
ncbi:hypothetical protein [Novipirellula artificiosorum]|uniref:hypothetical protein n=1 Tax=Novipirellula artificiosorum TaxID=2528016 RepID=UPI0011B6238D|nr:hypothetical protein [Novipirellula artificiosorum]